MGYYIFSKAIKTEIILSVFGSKNDEHLSKVKQGRTFDCYKDFLPEGRKTNPAQAIDDIIMGNKYDESSSFAYGYALICICDSFSENTPYQDEIKLGHESELIDDILQHYFKIDLGEEIDIILLEGSISFLNIPSRDDFPTIGLLKHPEIKKLKQNLEGVVITDKMIKELEDSEIEGDDEKAFAYTHLAGIIANLDFCLKNDLELISFSH